VIPFSTASGGRRVVLGTKALELQYKEGHQEVVAIDGTSVLGSRGSVED